MRWKKIGKIFDPRDYKLPFDLGEFCQSPQTLVFNDYIRVYFSTRERDNQGKFLSHVVYVDFDKNFRKVLRVSDSPVISLGNLGTYDEHGIFPLNILKVEDKVYGYIGGWNRRKSVSVDGSIGLAISNENGEEFVRIGDGPVVGPTLCEPFLVGDPFVIKTGREFTMYYIFGERWIEHPAETYPQRVYKITSAKSKDGVNWVKDNRAIIDVSLNADECQALPTVIEIDGTYHMYFCFREAHDFRTNSNNSYRLGYAHSNDSLNWVRDDSLVGLDISQDDWDSEMQCYPHVFRVEKSIYLLYNGNEFGRFGFGLAKLES